MVKPLSTDVFDCGPPIRLQKSLRLIKPDQRRIGWRAILVVLIAWAPLPILAAAQSFSLGADKLTTLLFDFAVHARFLLAAPLLIIAEAFSVPILESTARQFVDAGLVKKSEQGRFDQLRATTRGLLDSPVAEILVVVLAYVVVAVLVFEVAVSELPAWHTVESSGFLSSSWAGSWHAWVSIPILLMLLFGWLWRVLLWGFFLLRVSWFDLRLIPAHPDRAGGLQFVGASLQAFPLLGIALGAIIAGGVTNHVVHQGMSLLSFKYMIIAFLVVILLLFVAPLLPFAVTLFQARRKGIFGYGALANAVGHQLELKWLDRIADVDEGALEVQHFSATTDLYQVISNVYQIKSIPVDLKDLIAVLIAALLPFLPVLLYEMPLDVILPDLVKLLL
jgi:hypothetical protein